MPAIKQSAFSPGEVFRGTLLGLVVSLLGSVIIGAAYYYSSLSEHTLPWFSAGLYFCSILVGAWSAAWRAGNRGLIHGLAVALLFFAASWLISTFLLPHLNVSSTPPYQKLPLALLAGALGGVLGIGFRN